MIVGDKISRYGVVDEKCLVCVSDSLCLAVEWECEDSREEVW